MIPKIQETKASTARPRKTRANAQLLELRAPLGRLGAGGRRRDRRGLAGRRAAVGPSPLTLAGLAASVRGRGSRRARVPIGGAAPWQSEPRRHVVSLRWWPSRGSRSAASERGGGLRTDQRSPKEGGQDTGPAEPARQSSIGPVMDSDGRHAGAAPARGRRRGAARGPAGRAARRAGGRCGSSWGSTRRPPTSTSGTWWCSTSCAPSRTRATWSS